MPRLVPNQISKVYGRLTVLEYVGSGKWKCKCLCGGIVTVPNYYFKQIKYPTCSKCKTQQTHPLTYKSYGSMIQRCTNINSPDYHRYGGRGIIVCDRWKADFYYFLQDMGERPAQQFSLDRKDNELGYYKENCRWATKVQQSNNKSNTHKFDPSDIIHTPNGYWK